MPVEHITDFQTFQTAIATPLKLVVVDFHAQWCGPCHAIAPVYEQLATKYGPRARFLKVDVDEAEEIARYSSVSAMPTFHFYMHGSRVAQFSGADPSKLQAEVERLAPSIADVSFAGSGNRLGQDTASASVAGSAAGASAAVAAGGASMREALAAAAAKRFEAAKKVEEEKQPEKPKEEEEKQPEKIQEEDKKADAPEEPKPPEEASKQDEVMAEPAETQGGSNETNDARLNVNMVYLKQLVDEMGFPKIRAEKALILTGNRSVEQAVEWCFEHADDADIDEPLQLVTSEGAPKLKLSPEEAKRKADELYARARAKREEEEKIAMREREKERVRSGKEVVAAKQKLEDEARKRAIEEKKREKREALLQRQRVREMLEADKIRRREKFHMGGSSAPAPVAAPSPPKEEKREPTTSGGKIQFRLPDGSRIEGEFQAEHTMADLIAFLVSKRPELGVHVIQFSQQYPKKTFSNSEYGETLAELKLLPRGALTVSFS